jgi:GntR family transcriptional regulator
VQAIRELIHDELKPGDRLPNEHELVQRLGVSRATVREAITRLVADAVVEKRWGVGTFVRERFAGSALGVLSIRPGIPGALAMTGGKVELSHFQLIEAGPDPAGFPAFSTAPTVSLLRVFSLNGVPAVAVSDRVVAEFGGERVDFDAMRSPEVLMVDVLAAADVEFRIIDIDLRAAVMGEEELDRLGLVVPEPVIEAEGVGSDEQGRTILYARATYRTEVVRPRISASIGRDAAAT